MRVLIGCEFSGVVREAFRTLGHDAYSCDLLPTLIPSRRHIQADLLTVLNEGWDLLIAHPPCTYLTSAAAHLRNDPERLANMARAVEFVREINSASIGKVVIENPTGVLSSVLRKPDQIIHPFMFGDLRKKRTCLWLRGVPKLVATSSASMGDAEEWILKVPSNVMRRLSRSVTSSHVAWAMATQWGGVGI